jgi:hypothetical protein
MRKLLCPLVISAQPSFGVGWPHSWPQTPLIWRHFRDVLSRCRRRSGRFTLPASTLENVWRKSDIVVAEGVAALHAFAPPDDGSSR